jgi:hypothetical protein
MVSSTATRLVEQGNPTVDLTGRRATELLRRITNDATDRSAAPVQRFVVPPARRKLFPDESEASN